MKKVLVHVRDTSGELAPIVVDEQRYLDFQNVAKQHPVLREMRLPNGRTIAEDSEVANFLSSQLALVEHRGQLTGGHKTPLHATDDATGMNYLTSQLARIETSMIERYYVQPRYNAFLPVLRGTGIQWDSIRVQTSDTTGEAREIAQASDMVPYADVKTGVFDMAVSDPIAAGYQWNVLELQQSAFLRKPLDAMRAAAARRMFDNTLNQFALFGRASAVSGNPLRYPALYNGFVTPALTQGNKVTAITGTWNTATPLQVLNDVNKLLFAVHEASGFNAGANMLIVAPAIMNAWLQPMTTAGNQSLKSYIEQNNYTTAMLGQALTIVQGPGLENTNAFDPATTLNNRRAIAYDKSPDTLEFEVTQDLQWLPPQYDELTVRIPGFGRCTRGVKFKRPTNYAFMDGV
jgi:hypothetical protein